MKCIKNLIIFISLITFSFSLYAEQDREIQDLMYLPKQGTFTAEAGLFINNAETTFNVGTTSTTVDLDSKTAQLEVGHVPISNLLITLSLPYLASNDKTTTAVAGTTTITKSEGSGLRDINLEGKYRVIDNEYLLDLSASVSPKLGDNETNTKNTVSETNGYRGGTNFSLEAEFGQKLATFSYSILAEVQFTGEQEDNTISTTSTTLSTTSSHTDIKIGGAFQYMAHEQFFINLGAFLVQTGDYFSTGNTGTVTNITVDNYILLAAGLDLKLSSTVLARLAYAHVNQDATSGTTALEVAQNAFSISLALEF